MSPVRDTSILSYGQEHERGLGPRQKLVYDAILALNNMFIYPTDREIADTLRKADPNFVRPRRFELVKAGLIRVHGKKRCPVTGKLVYCWEAV